jgi:uncharacterized surface protein with fasciclin (FAS1) repeats
MFRFSAEMERKLLILDVNKDTLHLNTSSTSTGLVEQCRREPPLTVFSPF